MKWQHIAINYIPSGSISPSATFHLAAIRHQLYFIWQHIAISYVKQIDINYISSGISQLGMKLRPANLDHRSVSEMAAHRHKLYFIWQQIAISFQSVQCHAWQHIALNIPSKSSLIWINLIFHQLPVQLLQA